MDYSYKYITVEQPIGTFYITAIDSTELLEITEVKQRGKDPFGVQRNADDNRITEISNFCKEVDATFPTSIIISVYSSEKVKFNNDKIEFSLEKGEKIGNVIDGQHRLRGLERANLGKGFILPVVFMFDMQLEEEAYVFSIINSKQTSVSSSLLADLFGVTTHRSPQKVAHFIAKALNQDEASPFYGRMKMLGKKDRDQEIATISQGTFVDHFCKLIFSTPENKTRKIDITKDIKLSPIPDKIFRTWYIEEKDTVMYKVVLNCFIALKNVFEEEWKNPKDNIVWKSTGVCGIIRSLQVLVNNGLKNNDLTVEYFEGIFDSYKRHHLNNHKPTSQMYGSGEANHKRLCDDILSANSLL